MPTPRCYLATNTVDGKIYAMGGQGVGRQIHRTVEAYDPVTDAWEKRADMPTARFNLSATTVNGIIYAIGGFSDLGLRASQTVEAYDPATDTWDTMAAMPEGRSGFSTSVVDEKIFVFASYREFRRAVLIYTPPFRTPRSVDPVGKVATTWGR